jgi:hypothetical protein
MPFQFSGNNLSALIVADTITNIVDRLKAQLLLVGWTVVSGSSGDWTLLSGLTPHGLQCRVRIYNPGSGVTARIQFKSADGTLSSTDLFLQPNLRYPADMRVIACPYQFFAFYPGGQGLLNKSFICGGVPALYDFDVGVITQAVWCHGDATSDTDTVFRHSFKLKPNSYTNAAAWQLCNTVHWQSGGSGKGHTALVAQAGSVGWNFGGNSAVNPTRYYSGEAYKVPPDICWGLTGPSDLAYIRGMPWDAAMAMDWFPADVATTFDDHNWYNVMQVYTPIDPNPRETSDVGIPSLCSLWIVIP